VSWRLVDEHQQRPSFSGCGFLLPTSNHRFRSLVEAVKREKPLRNSIIFANDPWLLSRGFPIDKYINQLRKIRAVTAALEPSMAGTTHAELDLYRRRWVRVLIDTYALGKDALFEVYDFILTTNTGMYTVMVAMTVYNVSRRRSELPNRRFILGYTITMTFITAGWYYAATRVDEALIIESLAGPQVSSQLGLTVECTPTRVISDTLSLLQFWGNDALMV
jgi:hypothetical protein